MNIFTKIKNWLIKKLGGYTEEEYNKAVGGIRLEDKYKEHWHEAFRTEHENYLAMLNLYNTTVEQKQKPVEAAKAIKAHCKAQNYCENCELGDESGVCKVANSVPCYWDFRQVMFGEVIDE